MCTFAHLFPKFGTVNMMKILANTKASVDIACCLKLDIGKRVQTKQERVGSRHLGIKRLETRLPCQENCLVLLWRSDETSHRSKGGKIGLTRPYCLQVSSQIPETSEATDLSSCTFHDLIRIDVPYIQQFGAFGLNKLRANAASYRKIWCGEPSFSDDFTCLAYPSRHSTGSPAGLESFTIS